MFLRLHCKLLSLILFHGVFGFWAAAPKGTMSCRTQGDFRSSVRPFVRSFVRPPQALSGLKSALSGLKFTLSDLKYYLGQIKSPACFLKLWLNYHTKHVKIGDRYKALQKCDEMAPSRAL